MGFVVRRHQLGMEKPAASGPDRRADQVLVNCPWEKSCVPGESRSHGDGAPSQRVRRNDTVSVLTSTSATLHPAAIQDRACLCMPGPS